MDISTQIYSAPATYKEAVDSESFRLLSYAFTLTSDDEEAHDLCQETWARAFEAWGTFKGNSTFFTWLCAICRNAFLRSRRKRKNEVIVNSDRIGEKPASDADVELEWYECNPMEAGLYLAHLIFNMPEHHGFILECKAANMSYEQIAAALRIEKKRIGGQVHRAFEWAREREFICSAFDSTSWIRMFWSSFLALTPEGAEILFPKDIAPQSGWWRSFWHWYKFVSKNGFLFGTMSKFPYVPFFLVGNRPHSRYLQDIAYIYIDNFRDGGVNERTFLECFTRVGNTVSVADKYDKS